METQILNAKTILEKAYERLVPAIGYLISPQAGFAASVFVLTTWLLRKMKGIKKLTLEDEENILVELDKKIEDKKKKIRILKETLKKTRDEVERNRISRNIRLEEKILDSLQEEYDLHLLRIEAIMKLRELGETKLLSKIEELIDKLEKGKEAFKEQYEIIKTLEDKWLSLIHI